MKLSIFSHCVIDLINIHDSTFEQAGGPACYCSWTARNMKFDVDLFTKFGTDFNYEEYLSNKNINFFNAKSEQQTSRFKIDIHDSERTLYLVNKCESIEYSQIDSDGTIISPVFDELSEKNFELIKQNSNFTFLDPQGFLRKTDSNNKIILKKIDLNLSGISAIKTNPNEIKNLVGTSDDVAMKTIQKSGVQFVLLADKQEISMLEKDRIYSLTLPNREIYDTTGLGDIFSSAFCSTMLKENDSLWAFCFAGGAAQAGIETKKIGLQKVPHKGAIQTNASYFYNQIKFKQV